MYFIALVVETITALRILATCVLHALSKLSLVINSLALLYSILASNLFYKVGTN